jgi:hypothetical protein
MACMVLPWAAVATLINSLPLAGAVLASASRFAAQRGRMRDHGSSGAGGPRRRRTAAAPARGL